MMLSIQGAAMNILDDLWLGEVEQVVAAFEALPAPIRKPHTAKSGLVQLALLDHRARGTVKDDDALAQQAFKMFNSVRHQLGENEPPRN